mmetsp:Transcript_35598/g.62469  ORF Transcript_35598/g.62469 Transcript_35598/m.62469 type:complete len:219 (-) Transcript_35598:109-765(-)
MDVVAGFIASCCDCGWSELMEFDLAAAAFSSALLAATIAGCALFAATTLGCALLAGCFCCVDVDGEALLPGRVLATGPFLRTGVSSSDGVGLAVLTGDAFCRSCFPALLMLLMERVPALVIELEPESIVLTRTSELWIVPRSLGVLLFCLRTRPFLAYFDKMRDLATKCGCACCSVGVSLSSRSSSLDSRVSKLARGGSTSLFFVARRRSFARWWAVE